MDKCNLQSAIAVGTEDEEANQHHYDRGKQTDTIQGIKVELIMSILTNYRWSTIQED
ncbi:hypothetical protein TrispH2_011790, partial [Trichoplax sp. H2]